MPALRKLLAFRRLADAAEALPVAEQPDLLRIAMWRLEAGGRVEPGRMLESGRRALFAHDERLAERLARAALDAGGGVAAALLLGEVIGALGRHDEAEDLLAALRLDDASDEQVALVAIRRAAALFYGLSRRPDALAVLVDAEGRLTDRSWRDEVVCVRAGYELLNERPAAALDAVQPALEATRGRALVEATVIAAPALAVIGRGDDAVHVARRRLAARTELGDQYSMAGASLHVTWQGLGLMEAGKLAEAEALLLQAYDGHIEDRTRRGQAWCALTLGRLRHFQGRPQSAIRAFAEGAAAFDELGEDGPLRLCLSGQVIALAWRGDGEAAGATMAALHAVGDNPLLLFEADVERARGWAAVAADDLHTGQQWFRTAARRAAASQSWALEAAAWHDLARVGAPAGAAARMTELGSLATGSLIPARAAYVSALASQDPDGLLEAGDQFEDIGGFLFAAAASGAGSGSSRPARGRQRWRSAGSPGER